MPLRIAGKSYPLPNDPGQKGLNGEELDGIETEWGIDALVLFGGDDAVATPKNGYTSVRRIYAMAWMALNRSGVQISISEVMRNYAMEEFAHEEVSAPLDPAPAKGKAKAVAEVTDSADQTDTAT